MLHDHYAFEANPTNQCVRLRYWRVDERKNIETLCMAQ